MTHARVLLWLAAWPSLAAAQPRLGPAQWLFDFGSAERGSPVEHTFSLPNRGDLPLLVEQVKGPCGCTVAVVSGREVAPGGEARVAVTLDTTRLAGRTTKVVNVHTNDPARPVAVLALTGEVLADLVLAPSALYLGRVRRGDVVRREVLITPGRPGGTHAVGVVESDSRALRARIEPRDDGPGQRLVIELGPEAPLGRFHAELRLRTTSPHEPELRLGVFGSVEGDRAG